MAPSSCQLRPELFAEHTQTTKITLQQNYYNKTLRTGLRYIRTSILA